MMAPKRGTKSALRMTTESTKTLTKDDKRGVEGNKPLKKMPEVQVKRPRGRPRKIQDPSLIPVKVASKSCLKNKAPFSPLKKTPEKSVKNLRFQTESGDGTTEDKELPSTSSLPITPYPGKTPSGSDRIPRPLNAFMVFGRENRKRFLEENPGNSNKDISKLLGDAWKSLDEEEKKKYQEEAKKSQEQHKLLFPGYTYVPSEARKRKKLIKVKAGQVKIIEKVSEEISDKDVESKKISEEKDKQEKELGDEDKENKTPEGDVIATNSWSGALNTDRVPLKVITELFVAPPGYEDIEISGLDKFVLWERKLIPYRDWVQAEGDVKRLSCENYTTIPDLLFQPITEVVLADSVSAPTETEEEKSTGNTALMNTAFYQDQEEGLTLNEVNGMLSSETVRVATGTAIDFGSKSGSEMDVRCILEELMSGGGNAKETAVTGVVVEAQPQLTSLPWQSQQDVFTL